MRAESKRIAHSAGAFNIKAGSNGRANYIRIIANVLSTFAIKKEPNPAKQSPALTIYFYIISFSLSTAKNSSKSVLATSSSTSYSSKTNFSSSSSFDAFS